MNAPEPEQQIACGAPRILLLSVAVNGYALVFKDNLSSHARYAHRNGYTHCVVDRAGKIASSHAPWLKVVLTLEALRRGYDLVIAIDADCLIRDNAPEIACVLRSGKCLYMARGFSGRLNSGFFVAVNSAGCLQLLEEVVGNCEREVDDRDWGENAHFDYFAAQYSGLQELDARWNNNFRPGLNDYVRHFCGGSCVERQLRLPLWRLLVLKVLRKRLRRR